MSNHRQTILASRPAAMVLALSLVAGLTAPFVMLPRAQAAVTPLTCSENNHNGCTELSPTPPEDTVAVPPNIVLMLDDSGSMKANYMPDFSFLQNNGNNDALIDAANNGVYYNPTTTYSPPPKADSTAETPDLYTSYTDMTNVRQDGFGVHTTASVDLYTYDGAYECDHNGGGCGGNASKIDFNIMVLNAAASLQTYDETVNATYDRDCNQWNGRHTRCWDWGDWYIVKTAKQVCEATYTDTPGTGGYTFDGTDDSGECKFGFHAAYFFQYSTGPKTGPYVVHYVTAVATDCDYAPIPGNCVADSTSSGLKDASGKDIPVATNVANWFAYYHTRILMAKSGLMTAFSGLSPKYRFGYGAINTSGLVDVTPFGDGAAGTRKAQFYTWIAKKSAGNSTPLRRALQRVGTYYQTQQPWTSMPGDPGYSSTGTNTPYACRGSYTILTTDGFWNGGNPDSIGTDADGNPISLTGAADKAGPVYSPPAGTTYTITGYLAQGPFSGGAAQSGGNAVASLADVATYYWETDLQDGKNSSYNLADEVAPSNADPAFWQHMTTYTVGLGFDPTGITPAGTTKEQIFAWAHDGGGTTSTKKITGFGWPTPSPDNSGGIENIADLEHAAVNGHGDFFSVKSPEDMANSFVSTFADIGSRTVAAKTAAVNASVFTTGAVSFGTGYNTGTWTGTLEGKTLALDSDGTIGYATGWNAGSIEAGDTSDTLEVYHSAAGYGDRKVYTGAYKQVTTGSVTTNTFDAGFQFNVANEASLDTIETAGLGGDADCTASGDTLCTRINYLLGDNTNEGTLYRARTTLLGAIIRSQPVYVSYAASNYYDRWPSGAPEGDTTAQKYDAFVTQESTRAPTVYVGANDGMLHAFNAPVPECTAYDTDGTCKTYDFGTDSGKEIWAFIPRAVYANLGNLTSLNFSYRPTVDETPTTRDVFFTDKKWHTLLAGGVGLGGRGVYALDITDPAKFSASDVLWEFDSDATPDTDCTATYGTCRATDLGYTVSRPNISRLHNGKWAVLVSNGYFPDCTTPDTPTNDITNCQAIAAQAPKDSTGKPYSALFVLNAETGKMIAELKTPTDITGVTSFGLATAVLGDYDNDQIDDVAFAGDVQGNLWRFNLSDSDPSKWTVTLAYKGLAVGGVQGVQPITSMPHLFPDANSNLFMVTFGTGKFLGVGDNSNSTVQSVYGVRDQGNLATSAMAYEQSDLTRQYLHEEVEPAFEADGTTPNPLAGVTVRCVTGGASDSCDSGSATKLNDASSTGGWFINLKTTAKDGTQTDAGERVVVNPGAIFASNTVIFETLITGTENSDPCSPATVGAIMALNAVTGGPSGVSSLGGWPIVGGRITNARTSGSLPVVSALGGGQVYLPGTGLAPKGDKPMSLDAPIWRRRSWQEINQNQ